MLTRMTRASDPCCPGKEMWELLRGKVKGREPGRSGLKGSLVLGPWDPGEAGALPGGGSLVLGLDGGDPGDRLEVGEEGSPGLPPGDEPLSRDSFALRRLVRLIRRRMRGELGQEAAGGSMTRETR